MRNTGTSRSHFHFSALLTLVLAGSIPAAAEAASQTECRAAIASGLYKWSVETLHARMRCQSGIIEGLEDETADCLGGSGSTRLEEKLANATADLRQRLDSNCEGVNWGLLSYPGPCSGLSSGEFGTASLSACIEQVGLEATTRLFDVWYPSGLAARRGVAGACAKTVPKRAASMVLGELKFRLACLLAQETSGGESGLDCRGQLPPYSAGTGDGDLDDRLVHVQRRWLAGLPRACGRADFSALGYGAGCIYPLDTAAGLLDFHSCVFRANRVEVPLLLDLAFPSDPVCGNALHQEGEQCDDGAANSDTKPDACRLDCNLPACGDGTTDPSNLEACDDGNTTSLDGCDATCVVETCGDGIVNDAPHETCDDQNSNARDMCTNTCTVAVCGDAVVCDHPSCTTGRQGGPEQCDQGSANSNTQSDACRRDCTAPVCGDSVTDPSRGETCDDGNRADLDGCNAACREEVCGDGVINDVPLEECDDSNTNPRDMCTAACRVAVCGDGVLCDDSSCTTGPGGAAESCDLGTKNSADAICKPDCAGFSRTCVVTAGVTNAVKLGSLTFELSYQAASGEMQGSAGGVSCLSTFSGGFAIYSDDDEARFVKGSAIVDAGLQAPSAVVKCTFLTNDASLAATAFSFVVNLATDTNFNEVTANMAVTKIECQ